jgi:hypothetical protein
MPKVALWFFAVAPLYVLTGMSLGIYMGASMDFSLAPAHAHLNLIGWVTMALYGTFYALCPNAPQKLAWATFWLNNVAVIVMFPSLSMVLKYGDSSPFLLPMIVSEFVAVAALLCFIASVWSVVLKKA